MAAPKKTTAVDSAVNAIKSPISFKEFSKDPVKGLLFIVLLSIGYLYVDIKLSCTTCNITGVADVKSTIESVVASPNPATDALSIAFNTTENASAKVAIMNMLGQEVDAKTISAVANTSNKVVAAQKSNLFFGTGLMSDYNEVKVIDMANIDGSQNYRVIMRYTAGTQFGIGSDIVYYGAY
jgi:hypothetical protein